MERHGFGLSRQEVLDLFGNYVNQNKLKTPFKDNIPGPDYFRRFAEHSNLSLKKPRAVEYARTKAADLCIIQEHFNIIENLIKRLDLQNSPHSIWNLDETSYSHDPQKTRVIDLRGSESTRTTASTGKDHTTVLFASNAIGERSPPFVMFKRKYLWSEWTSEHAFPAALYTTTKKG